MLGGEASGHIICLNVNTTGDGIIAALQVLLAMKSTGLTLHDLKKDLIKFPQKITNIILNNTVIDLTNSRIESAIKESELELGKNGRIVLRKSGTEPLIRLMVEGKDESTVETISHQLKKVIEEVVESS
jgi:phosphoglucosamine mutase